MNPILKDWLQNLGCLLPLGFLGFCMALTGHWVSSETGPARVLISWQAHFWNGRHSSHLTTAMFLLPTFLGAWLVFVGCRRVLTGIGVYDRPPDNVGFKRPNGNT